MDENPDDHELVHSAKAGSEDAFSRLIDRYHERIYRVAVRIVNDPVEADEVAQEVFSRAISALGRFDFRASFYTWLVSIARNAAFDALRAMKRRARLKGSDDGLDQRPADGGSDPVAAAREQERAEKVRKALGRLNERDRTLLVLREYEDLQYEEIAQVMGCAVGTVESGLHRARKKLRLLLGDVEP